MVIVLCGPSGSGKTTIANELRAKFEVDIFTGKDYLRLAKSKNVAWEIFTSKLEIEYNQNKNAIYIITETEEVEKIKKIIGIKFLKIITDKEMLFDRFVKRMNGNSNPAFMKMIEMQIANWNKVKCDIEFDTSNNEKEHIINKIIELYFNS